jgi:hypothetical protein
MGCKKVTRISRKDYKQYGLTPIGIDIARLFEKRFLEMEKELKEMQPDWSSWAMREFLQYCMSAVLLREEAVKGFHNK